MFGAVQCKFYYVGPQILLVNLAQFEIHSRTRTITEKPQASMRSTFYSFPTTDLNRDISKWLSTFSTKKSRLGKNLTFLTIKAI